MNEKRRSTRTETSFAGRLLSEKLALACTVLDVSATGARLQIEPGMFLPKHFVLRSAGIEGDRNAAVVWRNRTQVGVKFDVVPTGRSLGDRRGRPR